MRSGPTADVDEARRRLRTVCGLANFAVAGTVAPDIDAVTAAVLRDLPRDREVPSFRVEVRRAHKQFPIASPDAERAIGSRIQDETGWRVDLSNPAFVVWVEIVPRQAYYYFDKEAGAGGLPVGHRRPRPGAALGRHRLTGGGVADDAPRLPRHLRALPRPSRSRRTPRSTRCASWCSVLAPYQLGAHVMFVPFGELQRQVTMAVPGPLRVVVYRRLMMRIAARLAGTVHARALVTGDVVGPGGLADPRQPGGDRRRHRPARHPSADRHVQGRDHPRRGHARRRIPISILPDEDCCTLFTPRHPSTRARPAAIEEAERALPIDRDDRRRRRPRPTSNGSSGRW